MSHRPLRVAEQELQELSPDLVLAFMPLHKRAFGMALGLTMGMLVFLVTVLAVLRPGYPEMLTLLSQYYYGYRVSLAGAVIGFAWTGFAFFVVGWFTAFLRNLFIALNIWIGYRRAELADTRDFLDHI